MLLVFFVVVLTAMPIHADFRGDVSSPSILVAAMLRQGLRGLRGVAMPIKISYSSR